MKISNIFLAFALTGLMASVYAAQDSISAIELVSTEKAQTPKQEEHCSQLEQLFRKANIVMMLKDNKPILIDTAAIFTFSQVTLGEKKNKVDVSYSSLINGLTVQETLTIEPLLNGDRKVTFGPCVSTMRAKKLT